MINDSPPDSFLVGEWLSNQLISSRSSNTSRESIKMFRRLIATSSTFATVPIRLALAVIFVAHGAQKVLGSFGGSGFRAFTAGTTPFNFMRPPWLWLAAAAISELVGGVLVGLGLLTRV